MNSASWRAGVRAGVPFAAAGFLLSLSFGVLARDAGFSAAAAIVMSAIVFAGSAQFAAIQIVAAGGGLGPGVFAAAPVEARVLPVGLSRPPPLPGRGPQRGARGQGGGGRPRAPGPPGGRHP